MTILRQMGRTERRRAAAVAAVLITMAALSGCMPGKEVVDKSAVAERLEEIVGVGSAEVRVGSSGVPGRHQLSATVGLDEVGRERLPEVVAESVAVVAHEALDAFDDFVFRVTRPSSSPNGRPVQVDLSESADELGLPGRFVASGLRMTRDELGSTVSPGSDRQEKGSDVDVIALKTEIAQVDGIDSATVRIASDGTPGRFTLRASLRLDDAVGDAVGPPVGQAVRVVADRALADESITSYTFTAVGIAPGRDSAARLPLEDHADALGLASAEFQGSALFYWRSDLASAVAR